jgi:hypothetical protein
MKIRASNLRSVSGILLIECMVYITVLAIILGVGSAAFYVCWDNSKALRYATGDVESALRAGERWRADVRSAKGKITVENSPEGELVRIPRGTNELFYKFSNDEVRRKSSSASSWILVLPRVKNSQMQMENRNQTVAWRWEVELMRRNMKTKLALLFTFEAAVPGMP